MIYIIADDLTGANDTGAQFVKNGFEVTVSIEKMGEVLKNDSNNSLVKVIDTETREINKDKAIKKISEIYKDMEIRDNDILYNKVDSTLRGNIGSEIELTMNYFNKSLCIFAPTFPANRRFTIGGYLIVNDKPLGISEYNERSLDSGSASYIPDILGEQTDLPVGIIELKEVMKGKENILLKIKELNDAGKKIIIVDAITSLHLQNILETSKDIDENLFYSGSAGLANAIAENNSRKINKFNYTYNDSPFLIINGSRNSMSNKQIDFLNKKENTLMINLDVKKIISDKFYLEDFLNDIISKYNNEKNIVVRPDPVYNTEQAIGKLIKEKSITFRKLGEKIRDSIGKISQKIVPSFNIKNIIVSGGDTLIGICKSLEVSDLNIIGELVEGIPIVEPLTEDEDINSIKLVTKAGGFGDVKTISELVDKLRRRD